MKPLSDRLNAMSYSKTFVMSNKARELKAAGKDVITLTLGEPDFQIPDFVKQEAIDAVNEGYKSYTPIPGYLELREAISKKFKRDNNLEYPANQIIVSTGGKQSIMNVLFSVVNKGDEVIIPAPYWVSYVEMVNIVQGKSIILPTSVESEFKITAEQLEAAITPKTKVLLYSSPCNPSGSVYSKEELQSIAQVVAKYPHITIISDEIYEYINYGEKHFSIAQFPEVLDQTATVNGLSKSYAMTGWRIGYLGGPKWLTDACDKIQGQITSGTNCIAQRAAIVALEKDPNYLGYMIEAFEERRNMMYDLLKEIKGFELNMPKGAFYFFPDISYFFGKTIKGKEIKDSDDFAMLLLEEALVATVGGVSFGDPNCVRFSYAASKEELQEACARIKKLLSDI